MDNLKVTQLDKAKSIMAEQYIYQDSLSKRASHADLQM